MDGSFVRAVNELQFCQAANRLNKPDGTQRRRTTNKNLFFLERLTCDGSRLRRCAFKILVAPGEIRCHGFDVPACARFGMHSGRMEALGKRSHPRKKAPISPAGGSFPLQLLGQLPGLIGAAGPPLGKRVRRNPVYPSNRVCGLPLENVFVGEQNEHIRFVLLTERVSSRAIVPCWESGNMR